MSAGRTLTAHQRIDRKSGETLASCATATSKQSKTRDRALQIRVSYRRLFAISAQAMLAVAGCSSPAGAAQNDPNSVDIVGFHLGLSPEQVQKLAAEKIKDADAQPIKKRLMMRSFSLENVLFGTRIKEGQKTQWYATENTEFIQINYSLSAAPSVMAINRTRYFSADVAPAIQPLISSLVEKYGPATAVEGGGTQPYLMYWSYGQALQTSERLPMRSTVQYCGNQLFGDGGPFALMREGNINFNPQYINGIWPKCGIVMMARIELLYSNPQLAHAITVSIGDYRQLQTSDHYIFDVLKNGEADAIKSGVSRASANKAPL